MFKATTAAVLLLSTTSFAAMDCRSILDKKEVRLEDLMKTQNVSKIEQNPKLVLAAVYQAIETQYGPLNLKAATVGINWDSMKQQGLKDIAGATTSNEQYFKIADFLFKFNDAHISVELPSTLSQKTPLQFHGLNEKIFVNRVDGNYPSNIRAPKPGDEVIAINGLSPKDFMAKFPGFTTAGNKLTNWDMFALRLNRWNEASGMPLSRLQWNDIEYTFSKMKTGETFTVKVPFETTGIGLIGRDVSRTNPDPVVLAGKSTSDSMLEEGRKIAPHTVEIADAVHSLLRTEAKGVIRDIGRSLKNPKADEGGEGKRIQIGELEPFFKLPADFKPIEIPKSVSLNPLLAPFFSSKMMMAGTFKYNGATVGFLRVPSYEGGSIMSLAPTIRYFIAKLEAQSDFVIFDQTHNPGGMVIYSHMLIKSLNGKYDPDKQMKFAVKPSQGFLRQYDQLRREIVANKDELFTKEEVAEFSKQLDSEYKKVYDAYVNNRDLSEPVSMLFLSEYIERATDAALKKIPFGDLMFSKFLGVDVTKPQTLTKYIEMLISPTCFSGGDATPADLQDLGRVVLVGTKENTNTGGAGGTVEEFSFRGSLEFIFRLTTSLMVRLGGRFVENYAVKADKNVPLTREDIADGFSTYFERVVKSAYEGWKAKSASNPNKP